MLIPKDVRTAVHNVNNATDVARAEQDRWVRAVSIARIYNKRVARDETLRMSLEHTATQLYRDILKRKGTEAGIREIRMRADRMARLNKPRACAIMVRVHTKLLRESNNG